MSADKVLSTQNSSGNIHRSLGRFKDVFKQNASDRHGVIRNSALRRRTIAFPQPFQFGNTLSARIPQVEYLGDMYIKLSVKAITGGGKYRENFAASIIDSFRLRNSGRLLQEHGESKAVFNYMLDNLSEDRLRQVEKIMGSNSADAQVVIIPIMAFFCSWVNKNCAKNTPLHYGKLSGNEGLVLEWTICPEANIVDGGTVNETGSLVQSAEIVFYEMLTESDLANTHKKETFVHKAVDFKTRSNIDLAAGVKKQVDITALTGANKFYYIDVVSDTDAGNEAYTSRTALDSISLDIDGREYMSVNTKEEMTADCLLWGQHRACSTDAGQNYMFMGVQGGHAHYGHLNTRDTKDVRMNLTCGVNATASITACQDVVFTIRNGGIYRAE